ncbi:MAG: helix-turn-helix domain-containing protein [Pseudomonadota bacterium]
MTKQHTQQCPIAGFLNLFGDRWTWLIVREAFYGSTRFTEFERYTGIAKNLLADRLSMLVEMGILEKQDIGARGTRFAYKLTKKGLSLNTVLLAMFQWGNTHLYRDGEEPLTIVERATGEPVSTMAVVSLDGRPLSPGDLMTLPGPGANELTTRRLNKIAAQTRAKLETQTAVPKNDGA